jgi:ribose 5-phosphate isomerase B
MRVAIGCDHRGLNLKNAIITSLSQEGHQFDDAGTNDTASVDYPDIAAKVGNEVAAGKAEYGILICGTGIGMCIAANKIKGIRAANCNDVFCALRSRAHNNVNVLCLGGDMLGEVLALEIVNTFISTEFLGGRHQRRLDKIE